MIKPTQDLGSGNKYVNTIAALILNNIEVKIEDCKLFIKFVKPYMNKEIGTRISIKFSKKPHKIRWGTTKVDLWGHKGNFRKAKIILYRPSIWTFIHEMAHCYRPFSKHNKEFGDMVDIMLNLWWKYYRTKNGNKN